MIRLFNHYFSLHTLLLTSFEALVLYGAVLLGFSLRLYGEDLPLPHGEAALFALVMLLSMGAVGLYQNRVEQFRSTLRRVLVAFGVTLLAMSVVFYLFPQAYLGRGVFALAAIGAVGGVLLVRLLFFRLTDIGLPRRRVLVLGNGKEAEDVIRLLHAGDRGRAVQYAGMYPVTQDRETAEGPRSVNHEHLLRTVRDLKVGEIVIAVRERRGGVLPLRQLLDARLLGTSVVDLATFYERELGLLQIDNLKASWLIFGNGFDQGIGRDVVKRLFDVLVSLTLLVLSLPITLLAILAVAIESGAPVFYRQERVGEGGRPFMIYKLRSMRTDAEKEGKPVWAAKDDNRITRVGAILRRTRIDELPQLFNVLRGDMSFVGPRPERSYFVAQLLEKVPYYDVRHSVKPGITGWSQVRFPYGASIDDALRKLQYDLYYVKNHSLFLDLLILVETIQVVVLGKGAR